jgi:DNA-binding transcriptional LysR family regulator
VPTRSPDLNLLPIAFALYDELSVSRAARLLGMSQPAVSMALRRMRETFDDPLFIRVPTGIAPTPRAHDIVRLARPLVQRLHQDLHKGAAFDPATTTRTITLAMSDVGEMAFLPRVLEQFRTRAPHCAVRSVSVPTAQLAHELEKGEVDVAVGYFPSLALKNFRHRRVRVHRFACLMRADHPLRAERLSPANFLTAEHVVVEAQGRSQEVLERFLERRRIRRKIALITPHFLGLPFIVARSNLIATMPYAVARQFASMSPQLAVAIPPYDIPGFELRLHWHRRFDNEPRNRWLRDQLMTVFSEDPAITVPPPYGRDGQLYSAIE